MPRRYLVTAGLPYSNGRLHVGHVAGAYLPADTYVRYLKASGHDVRFVCGSDDNGVAIEIAAMKSGQSPQQLSTHFHQLQKQDFAGLRIGFDIYGGTHQPDFVELHQRFSQEFFRRIHDQGCFVKRSAKQLYDPQARRFLPDRYVRGICHHCKDHETFGDQCEVTGAIIDPLLLINPVSVITGAPAQVRETTHWYLRLNQFEGRLQEWLSSKQGQWRAHVLNFALGQIKQGLPERAMTRDIEWGIPVPLDDPDARGKVLFVWFDAPIGYVSFTAALCQERDGDWRRYEQWWSDPETAIVNFIGEDNTVFHTLIWPAMLMADGRHQLATTVVANNFVNFRLGDGDEAKVSKSQTSPESPVWIQEYLKRFGPDALRYYLTAIAPETGRSAFDPGDFINRNNGELVATLGNFVNRSLAFAAKYLQGLVPSQPGSSAADQQLVVHAAQALERVGACIETFRFKAGLEELMNFARACNLYFGQREPWKTRASDPVDCGIAIATCIHAVQYLALLAYPFLPGAAAQILEMLNSSERAFVWQPPRPLSTGHQLGEVRILFPKLELDAMSTSPP